MKEYRQRPEANARMKEYRQRPEAKARIKEYYRRGYNNLNDAYVKNCLRRIGFKNDKISNETIEIKRALLLMHRELKKSKEVLNEFS